MTMGEVWVPAGEEERYIRFLLAATNDPHAVTTTHGPIGLIFYAPDDAINALNDALANGWEAPVWGNGAPAELPGFKPADTAEVCSESFVEDETIAVVPKRKGRPPGSKNKINAD